MKKQILISSLIAIAILGSTGIVLSSKASADQNENTTNNLVATTTELSTPKPIANNKNETVFVMTDENGNAKSKFIGSTIYDGAEELPFDFKINYFLDGQEISGKDLSGKSGHVKIIYNYNSIAKYQGKFVPFMAITGVNLDTTKFSNIKITNGKIINESSNVYTIAGYSLTGINANLGTDILPESFTIEADVNNFKLENTYTVFINEIFTDFDTSKLSDLDNLVSSINQLSDGVDRIVSGATDLSNGLFTALDGTKTLYEGSSALVANIKDISVGSEKISTLLNTLTKNNETLRAGADFLIDSTITQANESGLIPFVISRENFQMLPEDNQIRKTIEFGLGVQAYTKGAAEIAAGATNLSAGLTKLSAGATTLSDGLGSLVAGETKLYDGSVALKDGLTTLKTSGIDKLVNFANKDLASFTRNFRSTINAATSYKNFGGTNAKSVKFIIKTPSI